MRKAKIYRSIFNTIGLLIAALMLFPLLWMAVSGFKNKVEVSAMPFTFWPKEWLVSNYLDMLLSRHQSYFFIEGGTFLGSMLSTLEVSLFSLAWSLLLNSAAGYVFARLEFPMKRFLWAVYLLPWFVPGISTQIASFQTVHALNMLDTFWVLTIPGICYTYSIFFYRQFYLNVPSALEEAALLDGAGRIRIYTSIFLPMSATPFVVMGISVFLGYWNSYLWPALTLSNVKLYQINQVIAYFRSSQGNEQHLIMAASTLAALPTILLFLCFQRYIMGGIKISGMK